MAGLLDSDLVKFLAAPRAYYRDKREDEANQAFQGLLGTLQQQGPAQPGGVLESRPPDEQFWLKASAIPGYEGLAGQQLGIESQGVQAMQRQLQNQDYETNNLTMAQQLQLQLQQKRDQFAESIGIADMQRKWAGTNASIGSAGAAAQNSQMGALLKQAQLQGELQKLQTANGPLYNQLPAPERFKVNQQLLRNDAAVSSTIDVLDWAQNRAQGGLGTGKAGAFSTDWKLAVMPVLKDMMAAGALDNSEREWFENLMEDPGDKYLSQNQINKMKTIAQKVADYRAQGYQALGIQAPEVQGRGAVSRALGAQPQGKLKPYTPPGLLGRGQ